MLRLFRYGSSTSSHVMRSQSPSPDTVDFSLEKFMLVDETVKGSSPAVSSTVAACARLETVPERLDRDESSLMFPLRRVLTVEPRASAVELPMPTE